MTDLFLGDPLGVRTQDPHIKSVMLYRLSERISVMLFFRMRVQRYKKILIRHNYPIEIAVLFNIY